MFVPSFQRKIDAPVSGQSLAFMRIAFGFFLVWDIVLELFYGENEILYKYIQTPFHLKHWLFTWVEAWPNLTIAYIHYWAMLIASFFVMIGFYFRTSVIIAMALFSYIFFIDMTHYLNHYYLMIVIGILLAMLPANRVWSVDALRHPEWGRGDVPRWSVWSVRALIETVLIYAGIVKINYDWLGLEPLGEWLRGRSGWHFFGDLVHYDWFIAIGAYGTIALHLLGAPLLLWKRTRLATFFVYAVFHLSNSYTFDIGIFPFVTIAATLIFFPADWPSQFWKWCIVQKDRIKSHYAAKPAKPSKDGIFPRAAFACVLLFLLIQILLPMRPLLYPGREAWTMEGHYFSWRMKLFDKRVSKQVYTVVDPKSGEKWVVNDLRKYMWNKQYAYVGVNPYHVAQFARYLEEEWRQKGYEDVEVYAEVWSSLNFRKPALLVDPNVDMTEVEWGFAASPWVMPLNEPFLPREERVRVRLNMGVQD